MTVLYRLRPACLLVIGLFLALAQARATHIVGGEIELQYLGANRPLTHRVNLNLYFDDINGASGAKDPSVTLFIFRKRDNALVSPLTLPLISDTFISYSNPLCANTSGGVRTRLIRYSADVSFSQELNDPGGYYMVWERCCRNNVITNIVSPESTGSAFYLEFPAPYTGGTAFANSSPVFGIAKGDYVCTNRPFSFDFSAKDADGDSLVYQLVTPYKGFSTATQPNPGNPGTLLGPVATPGPYPLVQWARDISADRSIPGVPPLTVNARTGQLTVIANQVGLYVFSVEVREFRKVSRTGSFQQIGLVRRDFQLKVIECSPTDPPKLLMRVAGQPGFYKSGTVLTIQEKDQNCLSLLATDINIGQNIQVINASGSLAGLSITPSSLNIRNATDTLRTEFCFGRCAGDANGNVTLLIRAADDGCPQGLGDTLRVLLKIIPTANNKPAVSTNLPGNKGQATVGQSFTFAGFGKDIDNDNISLQATGRGFTLASAGMTFAPVSGTGTVSQTFAWKPLCAQATRSEYVVDIVAFDNRCNRPLGDTVTVRLSAIGAPSRPPTVRTTLPQPVVELTINPADTVNSAIRFDVLGNDPDRDTIRLFAQGRGFDYQQVGINFTGKRGLPMLQSPFLWRPTCELLKGKQEATFVLDFIDTDGSCQPRNSDTTTVTIKLKNLTVSPESIKIPNVFTPNSDGYNDFFTVPGLPPDNCTDQFRDVEIVNRWGKLLFRSTNRTFKWSGDDEPAGTYYYAIRFVTQTFKGPVTLLR
jgi:gliding motility-associated-like protein